MTKNTPQIIETKNYKITKKTFLIGIIYFSTQKQVSAENVLRKKHFDDAEGIQV